MFKKTPKKSATLTIFETKGYAPKTSKMKIGIIKKKGMKVKKEFRNKVKQLRIKAFKALTYMHKGSGSTFSLMWKETEKYMVKNNIERDWSIPTFEIYWKVSEKPYRQEFELFIPVESGL
jgi:hypothetical protein